MLLICGTEVEHGATFSIKNIPILDECGDEMLQTTLFTALKDKERWLRNGGLIYFESARLPEYCTPECLGPYDLLVWEKAGERLLYDLVRKKGLEVITNCLREAKTSGSGAPFGVPKEAEIEDFVILKKSRNIDGGTHGAHENYLIKDLLFSQLVSGVTNASHILTSFLVTRQIFCGAGWLTSFCHEHRENTDYLSHPVFYQISQRADFINLPFGATTTSDRPIINTRDEPLSRITRRRLHLIVGDANMSEWSLFLKIGVTSLVLTVLQEAPETFKNFPFFLYDPVSTIKDVSKDLTCRQPIIRTHNSKDVVSAIDIQDYFIKKCKAWYDYYSRKYKRSLLIEDVLAKWEFTKDTLARNPFELADKLDWLIKLRHIIRPLASRYGCLADWSIYSKSPQYPNSTIDFRDKEVDLFLVLKSAEYQYHRIDPGKSLYHYLLRKGKISRITTDEEIKHAADEPPANTRALLRGQFVKWHEEMLGHTLDRINMDWQRLSASCLPNIEIPNPYRTVNKELERLLRMSKEEIMELKDKRLQFKPQISYDFCGS